MLVLAHGDRRHRADRVTNLERCPSARFPSPGMRLRTSAATRWASLTVTLLSTRPCSASVCSTCGLRDFSSAWLCRRSSRSPLMSWHRWSEAGRAGGVWLAPKSTRASRAPHKRPLESAAMATCRDRLGNRLRCLTKSLFACSDCWQRASQVVGSWERWRYSSRICVSRLASSSATSCDSGNGGGWVCGARSIRRMIMQPNCTRHGGNLYVRGVESGRG